MNHDDDGDDDDDGITWCILIAQTVIEYVIIFK